jgi:hypothetical protein
LSRRSALIFAGTAGFQLLQAPHKRRLSGFIDQAAAALIDSPAAVVAQSGSAIDGIAAAVGLKPPKGILEC